MSATPYGAVSHIKWAWILVVILCAAIVTTNASVVFALIAEARLIGEYGFGHVPKVKIQPFIDLGKVTPMLGLGLSVLRMAVFGYFVFWCVKALDLLDIEHRFSRFFAGISIIIPLVGYYIPWASIGEARRTFEIMVERQMRLRKTVREFDFDSFLLGFVWIGGSFADRIIIAQTESGTINAGNWQQYLSNSTIWTGVVVGIDSIILLTVVSYGIGMLRRYRNALAVAATDVFATPDDDRMAQDSLAQDRIAEEAAPYVSGKETARS